MDRKFDPACARRILQRLKFLRRSCVWVGEYRNMAKSRHRLQQDILSLAVEIAREEADTRCIAARLGQRICQP